MLARGLTPPLRWVRDNESLVAVLIAAAVINIGQSSMAPVLPIYAQQLGVSVTLVGLAVGAFGIGRLVMNVSAGILADRFGRRLTLSIGPAVVAVAAVLMGFSNAYWQLLALRLVQGLRSGMFLTTVTVFTSEIAGPRRRARYLSYQQSAQIMGNGIGPAIGGVAAEVWGLHAPFYLFGALAFRLRG